MDYSLYLYTYRVSCMIAGAGFPEDSEPISISHGNYTKQYPVFVGHKPGRNSTQRHKLDIQLIVITNRTLYVAASCLSVCRSSVARLERRSTLTTLAALQLVRELNSQTTSQLFVSLNGKAGVPEPAGSQRGLGTDVATDCHGVTQNGSGSSSVTSPALVLVETPNESVCGGTVVSTEINGLLSHVQKAWCHSTSTPTAPSAGTVDHIYTVDIDTANTEEIFFSKLEYPHTVPADGAVGVEVEGHQAFWTCDDKPFILLLTTVPPHTDSLVASTKTKAGLVTEDDPLPF
ncbi:hypothetical protein NFI96_002034 [Prochilodus magdalenae]|nr:hypothetical protein NFI96_002034 [Prochilodus magdalenae]